MSGMESRLLQNRLEYLSKQLDAQKLRQQRSALEFQEQQNRVRALQNEIQMLLQQKSENILQISTLKQQNSQLKLRQNYQATQIRKLENQVQQLELNKDKMERLLIEKDELREQLIGTHREALFEKDKELAMKQRELNSMRAENIEMQKNLLKQRQNYQDKIGKLDRQIRRFKDQLQAVRKEADGMKISFLKSLQVTRGDFEKATEEFFKRVQEVEVVIQQRNTLKLQVNSLRKHVEDLVRENSRMVIDLYNAKI